MASRAVHAYILTYTCTSIHTQVARGVFGRYKVMMTLQDNAGRLYGGFDSTDYPVYFDIQQVCVCVCLLLNGLVFVCMYKRLRWAALLLRLNLLPCGNTLFCMM